MKNNTILWPWKHLPKNRTVHDEISSRCPPMRRCCPSRRCPSSTFARISHCKQAFMAAIQEAFCFRLLRLLDFAMWAVLWPVGFVMLVSRVFSFCVLWWNISWKLNCDQSFMWIMFVTMVRWMAQSTCTHRGFFLCDVILWFRALSVLCCKDMFIFCPMGWTLAWE